MTLVLTWPGNEPVAEISMSMISAEALPFEQRRFPDSECLVRLAGSCRGQHAVIVASLDRPDDKIMPLMFLADCLRAEGAISVGLIAPYLSYLRQDRQFHVGEAVTSRTFARLLSANFGWLLTVDPHLHRYNSLDEIYSIPTQVVHAAPAISDWIARNVHKPLLIGPDGESEQWVADIAARIEAPCTTLEKTRRGDREVEVSIPHLEKWPDRTPVLADDIISTGRTMITAIRRLRDVGAPAPLCVGVHAIFADGAYDELLASGAARVVTCNTIKHVSNDIDLAGLIGGAARELLLQFVRNAR